MFAATSSFAFFDYFRIPYRIVPAPSSLPHMNGSYGLLWRTGTDGPLLAWPLAGAAPRTRGSFHGVSVSGSKAPGSKSRACSQRGCQGTWDPARLHESETKAED